MNEKVKVHNIILEKFTHRFVYLISLIVCLLSIWTLGAILEKIEVLPVPLNRYYNNEICWIEFIVALFLTAYFFVQLIILKYERIAVADGSTALVLDRIAGSSVTKARLGFDYRNNESMEMLDVQVRALLLQYGSWLLPVLGFIGTVIGITNSLGGLSQTLSSLQNEAELSQGMAQVLAGLQFAFDTTLVGLVLAVPIVLFSSYIRVLTQRLHFELLMSEKKQKYTF